MHYDAAIGLRTISKAMSDSYDKAALADWSPEAWWPATDTVAYHAKNLSFALSRSGLHMVILSVFDIYAETETAPFQAPQTALPPVRDCLRLRADT
jgi:hypothetical protein